MNDGDGLELKVSITDIRQFKTVLNILTRMITDDRFDEQLRTKYLLELVENISR